MSKVEVKPFKVKLFDAKKSIAPISKEITNTFFKSKYFDINKLIEHIENALIDNRILLTQPIIDNRVYTILEDLDSDEKRESWLELKQDTKPQDKGSEITYYRRYTLQSLLGIASGDDDDANKSNQAKSQTNDLKWLNVLDANKKPTQDYKIVCGKIQALQYKSLDDIRKDYKVSKETETSLLKAFEQYQSI